MHVCVCVSLCVRMAGEYPRVWRDTLWACACCVYIARNQRWACCSYTAVYYSCVAVGLQCVAVCCSVVDFICLLHKLEGVKACCHCCHAHLLQVHCASGQNANLKLQWPGVFYVHYRRRKPVKKTIRFGLRYRLPFVRLMITFITCNSNLVPLLEGLYSSNPCRFEFRV